MPTIAGASNYFAQKALDHMLRNQSFTPPSTVYLALFTTVPGEDGTGGVEVGTSGSYIRQAIAWAAASSTTGQMASNADILFPVVTDVAGWGAIAGWGIYDQQAAGGNLLWGAAGITKTLAQNDQLKIASGNLTVTFTR